ncbi:hypothetical protein PAXRUDRAFT_19707 [Paxillus rubicundulus Ve08.2h10]|uniref:Uncharacterized protein n=1 Tax=Paxillus rubicundulus Ve08.2h10 TaxID=930991 RepID=A0A0D0CU38_9AGAM|nr:hypothetical protein PAXRUDRAFT_19707 [Paxillus rubicundulus Ve08.2h10]
MPHHHVPQTGRLASQLSTRDGVKQTSQKDDLPPWPQPQGIFSNGCTFHPVTFLNTVKDLIERASRLFTADGHMLFRLFKEFEVDPQTPDHYFHVHDRTKYLHISYLKQA